MKNILLTLLISVAVAGCVTPPVEKSALELQAIQTKEYETSKKTAFAATLSVFQDLGYTIGSANLDTGLITAKSPTRQDMALFVGQRMQDTKATAFIEEITPKQTKIRLSFVNAVQTSSGYGMRGEKETPVHDAQPYQEAFAKIQQGIFIRDNVK